METPHDPSSQLILRLNLDLRGSRFTVERETLMNLPESVLLCLFPNGLVLSRQAGEGADGEEEEEDVYFVDFDPRCFAFVLDFFKKSSEDFYGTPTQPGIFHLQQALLSPSSPGADPAHLAYEQQNPLLTKQAIIVLREELEYFAIPPKDGAARTLTDGSANNALADLKRDAGRELLARTKIFTALQRNVNKENNIAEQHLIDMLCMSGFNRDDAWGYRALEPARCCIASIALVLLNTGVVHHEDGRRPEIDREQMQTAQKLLLFWRKPARKCWWDGVDVALNSEDSSEAPADAPANAAAAATEAAEAGEAGKKVDEDAPPTEEAVKAGKTVRVWARRVWTLELSLI